MAATAKPAPTSTPMIQLVTSMSKPKAGSNAEPMAKPIPPTARTTPSAQKK